MTKRTQPRSWVELPPKTIERALDGDRAAFEEVYTHYSGIVRGAVASRIRRWPSLSSQMEDILSDIWVQLLADDRKVLRYYDPDRGPFGYFIRLVAATKVSTVLRRQARRSGAAATIVDLPVEYDEEIERVLMQRDFIEALWAEAQTTLKDVDQQLLTQVLVLGRETKEVAAELGLKRDAAYQRINRLRRRLTQIAERLLADGSGTRRSSPDFAAAVLMQALVVLPTLTLGAPGSTVGRCFNPDVSSVSPKG
ncbi:MAG: sigma-70 family RNA polymerase sigma factor [Myxococcota bacterium]